MRQTAWLVCASLLVLGCGGSANMEYLAQSGGDALAVAQQPARAAAEAAQEAPSRLIEQRKIIYNSDIDLVVEHFAEAESRIPEIIEQHGGYIADLTVDRTRGSYLTGRFSARVPTQNYNALLSALESLGSPETRTQTAQEVTEEYVDLQSRIASKQQLEARILKLLETQGATLEKVIHVERELARVREEVERMQGRLRYLTNRVALATVTINLREERAYEPAEVPAFAARVEQAWSASVLSLRRLGESLTIAVVVLTPWLVIILPITAIGWYLLRRSKLLQRALGGS